MRDKKPKRNIGSSEVEVRLHTDLPSLPLQNNEVTYVGYRPSGGEMTHQTTRRGASWVWQHRPTPDGNGWYERKVEFFRSLVTGNYQYDWVWLWWPSGHTELHAHDTAPEVTGWTHWKPSDGPPITESENTTEER